MEKLLVAAWRVGSLENPVSPEEDRLSSSVMSAGAGPGLMCIVTNYMNGISRLIEGPNKVRMIVKWILPLIEGQVSDSRHQIWTIIPHMTWDNYFSGRLVFKFLGELGFGATMMCHRDCLPKEIPETNLHKKKTDLLPRPKVARFFNPVNAVKQVPAVDNKKGYHRVLYILSSNQLPLVTSQQ
jgi:hypothetical protein